MNDEMEMTKHRLFENGLVKNVKLYPGSDRDLIPGELSEQVLRVVSEIENDELELREFGDDD